MRRLLVRTAIVVTLAALAMVGGAAIWLWPDIAELQQTIARDAGSRYPRVVELAFIAAEAPWLVRHRSQSMHASFVQQMVKWQTAPSRSLERMAREMLVAAYIERSTPESQVVTAYLSGVYLGRVGNASIYGVPAGANAYFHKSVMNLSVAEAATLAGMVRNPSYYSPLVHPERAALRRDYVLSEMRRLKVISETAVHGRPPSP